MSAILGINSFHADAAACLLVDGILVGAVAEERLGERLKHSPKFPENAIRWLLESNGLRLRDVTHVAIPRDTSVNRAARVKHVLKNPISGSKAAVEHLRRKKQTADLLTQLATICGEDPATVRFKTVHVEHHLAHVASAYYASPFEELTAGLSYDASGDFVSAMTARCEGNKIEVLDRVALPDSLGFFYTAMCQFIGFEQFGEEYKVMGLAPYGQDNHRDLMAKLVAPTSNGLFKLGSGYIGMHNGGESGELDDRSHLVMGRLYSEKLTAELGPARRREDPVTQREKDIARSTQVRFEEVAVSVVDALQKKLGTPRIAMAGGCALNGVANARILRETGIESPYLQAAASDDGTCLGAALYCWHNVAGGTERFHMKHAFWGPGYGAEDMRHAAEGALQSADLEECADQESMLERASWLLSEGLVVGWYQGRSEWGPRALGNRSILANPAEPSMKETINSKIKRREGFRPFAPSVLLSRAAEYFEQPVDSRFMMHVVKIKPEWRDRLPAITHVDGTGRLQTVDPESNALYHSLIERFEQRTGIGMLLNTSFNENEPVVDRPEQAVDCFLRTDMDALVLGNLVLVKSSIARELADRAKASN